MNDDQDRAVPGTVYLVGAGPGDPWLVTRRAEALIRSCGAVVYDYLVDGSLLDWAGPECRLLCVGKRAGFHSMPQEQIGELLVSLAREGLGVVRLKGGDPFVFGRGGEGMQRLRERGVPVEVVPAVTAAIGGAARAGIPLSHRNHNAAIVFLTGHQDPAREDAGVDWAAYARLDATLCLYMAMGRLAEICRALIEGGMAPDRPAAVVQWATTPRERVLRGPVAEIAAAAAEAGFEAPAVVYIGSTADLSGHPG